MTDLDTTDTPRIVALAQRRDGDHLLIGRHTTKQELDEELAYVKYAMHRHWIGYTAAAVRKEKKIWKRNA